MEPIPGGMTLDTFTVQIEVIKSSKEPFSEYLYQYSIMCAGKVDMASCAWGAPTFVRF